MPTYVLDAGGKRRYEFDSDCLKRCVAPCGPCAQQTRTFSSILKDKLFWKLSALAEGGGCPRGPPPRHTPPSSSRPSPSRVRRASQGDAPAATAAPTPVLRTPTTAAARGASNGDAASVYEDLGPDSAYWQPRQPEPAATAPDGVLSRAASVPHLEQAEDRRRQNMYDEYMQQVTERNRRRQQKVIKISDPESVTGPRARRANVDMLTAEHRQQHHHQDHRLHDQRAHQLRSRAVDGGLATAGPAEDILTQLQRRAAERNCVLIKDSADREHAAVTEVQQLPKHLQEFLAFARDGSEPDGGGGGAGGGGGGEQRRRGGGVWSPGSTADGLPDGADGYEGGPSPTPSAASPVPAVWTPRSAGASPLTERKAFRPVNFTSPQLPRKAQPQPRPPQSGPAAAPDPCPAPWRDGDAGACQLPRAPNPTVTLLQKAREGHIPRGARYLDSEEQQQPLRTATAPVDSQDRLDGGPGGTGGPAQDADISGLRIVRGGDVDGPPAALRSEVRDDSRERWYKRMYEQLHKIKQDDDYVTVRYRPAHKDQRISSRRREGAATQFRWPGGRTSGYQSEPELGHSDATKYYTLDRRRGPPRQQQQPLQQPLQQQQQRHESPVPPPPPPPASSAAAAGGAPTVTTPRSRAVSESLKYAAEVYKNQPGRISEYEPGKSSISEKEAKQWWDEVLDIFDGMEKRNKENLPAFKPTFMTYALKESGYESDTQLVVRRREDGPPEPLSPAQQRTAYKEIQKGGDVPLHGLRKAAPERPRESPHRYTDSEVTIRYRSPVSARELDAGGRPLSEQELSRRQAEAMRRLYQEERRRKYLHELQDISARRHTDNFTPSQKSPIPLNRYDDLLDEYWTAGRSSTPVARLAAKALYNFVGQTPRELSFRRGDVILVKRQVDRNWYEGELSGMAGLFPANYVEVLPYDHLRATPTKRVQEGQARAKFNFIAQTRLELSLAKGELVNLTRRVDENWFEGRVGSQKGIFPVSYVEVLLEPSERPATTPIPTGKPVASPAAHSLILNGGSNGPASMQQHSYQPPTSRSPANYSGVTAYGAVPSAAIAPAQPKQSQPQALAVHQALHVDTHSDPVPYRALYNYRPQNDDELELLEGDAVLVMEKCDDGWYVGSSQRTGFFGTFPGNYVERI